MSYILHSLRHPNTWPQLLALSEDVMELLGANNLAGGSASLGGGLWEYSAVPLS